MKRLNVRGTSAMSKRQLLAELLQSCAAKDFAGYSKFDALNSPVLDKLSFGNSFLRLLFTQLVKECPYHIRPWLGVEQSRNPKGIALFASAYLSLYEIDQNREHLAKAQELLQWLIENRSPANQSYCWGYNFIWQSQIFYVGKYEPNAVVTVFAAEALLQAYRITGDQRYFEVARSAGQFLLTELPVLFESDSERAISYVKYRAARIVLNTQVLTGAVFVKLYAIDHDPKWLSVAQKQYQFTVNRTIKDCTWSYAYPAERYHAVDNYHTGGVLDALLDYFEATGDPRFQDLYWRGLTYYRDKLFEADGAPRWLDNKPFPRDIHGAAQGIISFTRASYHRQEFLKSAENVYSWTVQNMYDRDRSEFIYRIGRWLRWDYSLMRWCNGWMSRAIAELNKREAVSIAGGVDDRQSASLR